MVKTRSKLKSTTDKTPALQPNERFYTVDYVPQGTKPNPRPQLTIKDRWLEQIGFYVGCPVSLRLNRASRLLNLLYRLKQQK